MLYTTHTSCRGNIQVDTASGHDVSFVQDSPSSLSLCMYWHTSYEYKTPSVQYIQNRYQTVHVNQPSNLNKEVICNSNGHNH